MERRSFLKFLLGTAAATYVDYEKLLWVPGEKTIFVPEVDSSMFGIPYHQTDASMGTWLGLNRMVAIEVERIRPHLKQLFERDDVFYKILEKKDG